MDPVTALQRLGGVATYGELLGPTTRSELLRALRHDRIIKVRRNRYALVDTDEQVRRAAAHPPTQPISSVDADEDGESDGLVWDLPNAEVGEEIENPPASPLSARNVTGQDGDILIGERPSKVPYVLLGVSAAIALVLVVIALLLIF